jgi:hypothetical protein
MSANDRAIETLRREIAKLQTDGAAIARKDAGIRARLASAMAAQAKAKTASALKLKQAEAPRLEKELMARSKSQADIATKIAKKQSSLSAKLVVQANEAKKADAKAKKTQEQVSKTHEEATRKLEAGYRKLTLENQSLEQRLQRELSAMKPTAAPTTHADLTSATPHDIFISHAWEDKADFVEALAHTLRAAGAEVWYDDFSLRPGDSLRRSIDKGLGSSRFGIVVLSTHFFKKEWPQKELDGLFQLESSGRSRILPIWHKVSKDEVASFSPTMADKLAFNTSTKSVEEIVADLMAIIRD